MCAAGSLLSRCLAGDAAPLPPQLLWTIVCGYMLRSLEVRHDLESSLDELDLDFKQQ